MDKLAEALIELAKQGGPVAKWLIVMYYAYWSVSAMCITSTFLGIAWFVCRTILKYQERDIAASERRFKG